MLKPPGFLGFAQGIEHMLLPISRRIENAASVIVAEPRSDAGWRDIVESRGHSVDHLIEWRTIDAVAGRQLARMSEKIHRVDVVVDGLLEVKPILANLLTGLIQNEVPTQRAPTL